MKAFEFTLLKCFVDHGLIVEIAPVYRKIETDASGEALVEVVIDAKQEVRSSTEEQSPLDVDRVLSFEGHLEPLLSPRAFEEAARKNPDLAQGKMARFYPGVYSFPVEERALDKTKTQGPGPFRYRTTRAGVGASDGLETVTVLTKGYLDDNYELAEVMIDSTTPAASILQFLSEMTGGGFQPVTAFRGFVSWFQPSNSKARIEDRRQKPIVDPLGRTLAAFLDEALVRQGFLAEDSNAPATRGLDWLAALLQSRAVIAIETDLPFSERTIAQALESKISMPLAIMQPAAPPDMSLSYIPPKQPSCVILPMTAYTQLTDPEWVAYELMSGDHSALIGCSNIRSLPEPLRRIIETTITLPRIDRPIFDRLFASLFGIRPPEDGHKNNGDSWIQYVQPWDLARIARLDPNSSRAYAMIKHRVEDRLRRVTPHHGPSLGDLHGLGEARIRAEMLIADIQAAVAGSIPWSQVDRGMLLAGPPGCGKTALARAIAKDCGVRFVECSASRWQMAGYLNDHLAAMSRDFTEARRFEPSILFIDEIDSIGSRDHFSGSNTSYNTQVVNALLAELQGFSGRGKVIVIAATNDVENVDPALRRAGRLDRVVKVSLPTIDALEKIFAFYLEKHKAPIGPESDIALRPLAEAAFGRTGADVSLAVRGSLRRARLAARPLCQDDLLAELYGRPLDRDRDRPLSGEGIRRVALHEAGHALVRLKSGSAFGHVGYVSIVPRPDGSLGFMALKPNTDATTLNRKDFLAYLQVTLGGRAAEEVFYGADEVGAGAGGGETSDLSKATTLAFDMICRLGLGTRALLLWRETASSDDCQEAEKLIAEAYEQARRLIHTHRNLVERIAAVLIERQEISGEELQKLVE